MHQVLISHIKRFIPVSDRLQTRLAEISEVQHFAKGSFLHQPGRICNTTYFICSGLIRVYYQKDDKEITDSFAAEGEWITSIYSFMRNVPDNCYIQTLEPCELLAIHLNQLEQSFEVFPEMERFGRMLMSKLYVEQSERIVSMQFHTAKERYEYFLKTSGNKVSRVPLGMLASYIGITQETLSRIRAEKNVF